MTRNVLVALFRNDLRIHDNPFLHIAHHPNSNISSRITHVLPVYVFDERVLELGGLPGWKNSHSKGPRTPIMGLWKTGRHRTRFITESVLDLRDKLRAMGSDLHISYGIPERIIVNIIKHLQEQGDHVEGLWMTKEFTSEELTVERRIKNSLSKLSHPAPLHFIDHKTLVHPSDMPFTPEECPDVYTSFRKDVEGLGETMVRPCLSTFADDTGVNHLKPVPPEIFQLPNEEIQAYTRPSSESDEEILKYMLKPFENSPPSNSGPKDAFPFKGGETAALERLEHYISDTNANAPIATYKQTRNGLVGANFSTKFSPYLAFGCLSPRLISQRIDEFDKAHTPRGKGTKDTYWVRFELLWRDYFAIIALKYGNQFFKLEGIRGVLDKKYDSGKDHWKPHDLDKGEDSLVRRYMEGRTGVPFIDANMIELKETGYMSNRGRQNVASYLSKDLGFDWRIGAEIFEEYLLDYDPCSNYGNWMYSAGVGTDPRDSRQFNPIKQAKDYDPQCKYIKTWIPALQSIPPAHAHHPWTLPNADSNPHGLSESDWKIYGQKNPPGEQKSWQSQYQRRVGSGSKVGGNPSERVEHYPHSHGAQDRNGERKKKGSGRGRGHARGRGRGRENGQVGEREDGKREAKE